jgi:hypothetical protein
MINRISGLMSLLLCLALPNIALAVPPDPVADLAAQIFSISVAITSGGSQADVAQIPEGQVFILTQYCRTSSGPGFGPVLQGSTFGVIPSAGGDQACTTYTPGVLLRGAQTISCSTLFQVFEDAYCMITGYKQKR